MIGLGIDTGGTCTDAVLFDMDKRQVLSWGKTQTTKHNLERGIDTALGQLDKALLSQVKMVSLSTTLATNACVEGRGGRVKLLFIGVDQKVVEETYEKYGFTSTDDFVFLPGEPKEGFEPDFGQLEKMADCFEGAGGIAITQLFASRNAGTYEQQAKAILEKYYEVPIICAYELFSDLNAITRGAGAFLNAQLIPLIEEFLHAVKIVLEKRNIDAPIYIVRSDGSLMNESFTRKNPVETLLCGPAASALGGAYMAEVSDGLIVDIGGTTTDVAIMNQGMLKSVTDGISIGSWKTFVKGMYIDTFGLGGDSGLKIEQRQLVLANYRLMPVCMAAYDFPELKERILDGCSQKAYSWVVPYEGFVLIKPIDESLDYEEYEKKLVRALGKSPLLLQEAADAIRMDFYSMNTDRLEKEGAILRFGLTPTDMMHVRGDFTDYDGEVSAAAFEWLSRYLKTTTEELIDLVYEKVTKKLYCNLVRILLENGCERYKNGVPGEVLDFIDESYYVNAGPDGGTLGAGTVKSAGHSHFVGMRPTFSTDYTLVGVGAPTHVFLPMVAKKLGTECVLPEYAKVANALGTLAGRISVTRRAEIKLCAEEAGVYEVILGGRRFPFEDCELAEEKALEYLKEITRDAVLERGGDENISFITEVKQFKPQLNYGAVLMGSTVVVTAYAYPKK
ncbi:MAG: hydantoinase/oxoprolinase family protein [Agathobacter sp.]